MAAWDLETSTDDEVLESELLEEEVLSSSQESLKNLEPEAEVLLGEVCQPRLRC